MTLNQPVFKDDEYLSVAEKQEIFGRWKRFIDKNFHKRYFSEQLLEFLQVNFTCFPLKYSTGVCKDCFHRSYFEDPEDTLNFLNEFSEGGQVYQQLRRLGRYQPRDDIISACVSYWQDYPDRSEIITMLQEQVKENDINTAIVLLKKHGMIIKISGSR